MLQEQISVLCGDLIATGLDEGSMFEMVELLVQFKNVNEMTLGDLVLFWNIFCKLPACSDTPPLLHSSLLHKTVFRPFHCSRKSF